MLLHMVLLSNQLHTESDFVGPMQVEYTSPYNIARKVPGAWHYDVAYDDLKASSGGCNLAILSAWLSAGSHCL